eukprot:1045176-Pelagomonas_calceolata.AAC.14
MPSCTAAHTAYHCNNSCRLRHHHSLLAATPAQPSFPCVAFFVACHVFFVAGRVGNGILAQGAGLLSGGWLACHTSV